LGRKELDTTRILVARNIRLFFFVQLWFMVCSYLVRILFFFSCEVWLFVSVFGWVIKFICCCWKKNNIEYVINILNIYYRHHKKYSWGRLIPQTEPLRVNGIPHPGSGERRGGRGVATCTQPPTLPVWQKSTPSVWVPFRLHMVWFHFLFFYSKNKKASHGLVPFYVFVF